VYAVGFFAERKTIKALQRKHSKGKVESSFARDFAEHRSTKSLLLRFHRGVSSGDVSDALGEALVSNVGKESAKKFQDFLLNMLDDRVEKGADIYITFRIDEREGLKRNQHQGLELSDFQYLPGIETRLPTGQGRL